MYLKGKIRTGDVAIATYGESELCRGFSLSSVFSSPLFKFCKVFRGGYTNRKRILGLQDETCFFHGIFILEDNRARRN